MKTINDILPTMELTHQIAMKKMLEDAGIPIEATVNHVLNVFAHGTDVYKSLNLEETKALISLMSGDRTKFAAKLTFNQRCEILAMHRAGVSRDILAKAYNIDRRTVTHIYNKDSKHYADVKQKEIEVGHTAFQKMYITQDVLDKVLAQRQIKEATAIHTNNKSANRKAGPHTVQGELCGYPHNVIIAWKDRGDPADMDGESIAESGWYFNDLDGDFPNQWLQAGEESMKTSDACYRAMLKEISDKI